MRNQQSVDMNSRVTFKLAKETQEIMFKHFFKAERYHLIQVFAVAWEALLQLEMIINKKAFARSVVFTTCNVGVCFLNEDFGKPEVSHSEFIPYFLRWG